MSFGLHPQHEAFIRASGVAPEVAQARGYVSADTKATLARFGFSPAQRRVPGLLIPLWRVTGEQTFPQYRPDEPRLGQDGKPIKYETPPKVRMVLDVHPHARLWLADPQRPLFITEGVRKADAAVSRGLCCIALLGVWNWRGRNSQGGKTALPDWELVALNGRQVYIVFDSDVMVQPQVHSALVRVKAFLEMRGARVALVYLPAGEGGAKVGLDDYLAAGHTVADLLALATTDIRTPAASPAAAPPAHHPSLATAPPAEARPVEKEEEPPNLAAVLAAVAGFLRRFVAFASPHQVTAVTLWAAATHAVEAAEITLYLIITSPEMRSGKTLLLKLLRFLVPRPWAVVCPSEAVVYRKIASERPTVLLDEVDAIFKDKTDRYEGLRALLNAGNERGATVPRCVGEGTKQQVVEFPVFCPKALAGIGAFPVTVADRGTPIRLQRRAPYEKIEKARRRELAAVAAPIKAALEQWAAGAVPLLRDARPEIPDALNDRAADAWELLFAIADLAGGDWPRLTREAASSLHDAMAQEETVGVALLSAIREIFEAENTDRLPTADLIRALVERDDGPWSEWWGKAVGAGDFRGPGYRLSRLLKPYEVRRRDIWTPEGSRMGYYRVDFSEAFTRYSPSSPAERADKPITQAGLAFQPSARSAAEETSRGPEAASGLDYRLIGSFETQNGGKGEFRPPDAESLVSPDGGIEIGEPLCTPEDLAKAGGRGQFILRIGEGTSWYPYPYTPGRSIAPGKAAWLAFVRNNSAEELERATAAMLTDPALTGGARDG